MAEVFFNKYIYANAEKATAVKVPQEWPIVLLVASGIWYVQAEAKRRMMIRQRETMGRESFMTRFIEEHELAFGSIHDIPAKIRTADSKGSAHHGLHTDGGLPETANGLGWYSMNRLGYREWYGLSCARLAYDELMESSPKVVFDMLVTASHFPWLAIGAGVTYMLSSTKRVYCLYKDNGIQVAKYSIWSKIKCASTCTLKYLALISIFKIITDNYEIDWRDMMGKYIPVFNK